MSFRSRSLTDANTPLAITSRSIRANHRLTVRTDLGRSGFLRALARLLEEPVLEASKLTPIVRCRHCELRPVPGNRGQASLPQIACLDLEAEITPSEIKSQDVIAKR